MDQHGAFAMPTGSRFGCVIALQDRAGIDVTFLPSPKAGEKRVDLVQLGLDHLMVIIAPRVLRDPTCSGALRLPNFFTALHIIHFAVCSVEQPFAEFCRVRWVSATSYATGVETSLLCEGNKLRLQFRQ